ncbi:MAG: hypothetical protein KJ706_04030, partial [Candidatus Omnitrophica bacterium]|nr:hypothetical protein [Candidatus Omnitrophota bacterium]
IGEVKKIAEKTDEIEVSIERFEHRYGEKFGKLLFSRVNDELGERYISLAYHVEIGVRFDKFKEFIEEQPLSVKSLSNKDILESFCNWLGQTKIYRAVALTEDEFDNIWNGGEDLKGKINSLNYVDDFEAILEKIGLFGFSMLRNDPTPESMLRLEADYPLFSVAVARENVIPYIIFEASLYKDKCLPEGHNLYIFEADVPESLLIPAHWDYKDNAEYLWNRRPAKVDKEGDAYILFYEMNEYWIPDKIDRKQILSYERLDRESLKTKLNGLTDKSRKEFIEQLEIFKGSEEFNRLKALVPSARNILEFIQSLSPSDILQSNFSIMTETVLEPVLTWSGDDITTQLDQEYLIPTKELIDFFEEMIGRASNLVYMESLYRTVFSTAPSSDI